MKAHPGVRRSPSGWRLLGRPAPSGAVLQVFVHHGFDFFHAGYWLASGCTTPGNSTRSSFFLLVGLTAAALPLPFVLAAGGGAVLLLPWQTTASVLSRPFCLPYDVLADSPLLRVYLLCWRPWRIFLPWRWLVFLFCTWRFWHCALACRRPIAGFSLRRLCCGRGGVHARLAAVAAATAPTPATLAAAALASAQVLVSSRSRLWPGFRRV